MQDMQDIQEQTIKQTSKCYLSPDWKLWIINRIKEKRPTLLSPFFSCELVQEEEEEVTNQSNQIIIEIQYRKRKQSTQLTNKMWNEWIKGIGDEKGSDWYQQ